MLDRKKSLGVAVGGICTALLTARVLAGPSFLSTVVTTAGVGVEDAHDKKGQAKHDEHDEHDEQRDHDEHGGKDDDEHDEGEVHKAIEQSVPMNMVPAAILAAVKEEVPNGTITKAELVAEHHKIVYSFDVKAGDQAYDVEISVAGKFVSKIADDGNEKDEKEEKKPEVPETK